MKKVIIFGTGMFSDVLYKFLLEDKDYDICAFTLDKRLISVKEHRGLPLVPFEEVEILYPPKEYSIFICIGYQKMNKVREEIFLSAKNKGYEILSYRHKSSLIFTDDIGEGNIFLESVNIGSFVKIGDGNIFWPCCHIAHHSIVENFNIFTISVTVAGAVKIGNNCFFGNNCTVRDRVNISDYTLVGAGAYIDKDTDEFSVYVPPRSICLSNKNSLDFFQKLNSFYITHYKFVEVSAYTGEGIEDLKNAIEDTLQTFRKNVSIILPFSEGKMLEEIHDTCEVIKKEYVETGVKLEIYATDKIFNQIQKYLI